MEQLLEMTTVAETALTIQRDSQRIAKVKILGLRSKNGREYLPETLQRALPLYEGAKVNVNHPRGLTTAPRDYQDRLGSLVDVIYAPDDGLYGDLIYNPKHPLAEQLLWDAEHAPQQVGLSHNVLARTERRGETIVVTEIVAVTSVDLVADPATTHGLFEGLEKANNRPITHENTPILPTTMQTTTEQHTAATLLELTERCEQQQRTIQEQAHALQQANEQVQLLERRLLVQRLLHESGLPSPFADGSNVLVDAMFLASLESAPDEPTVRQLIAGRCQLIEQARAWQPSRALGPQSHEQGRANMLNQAACTSVQDFVAAITK